MQILRKQRRVKWIKQDAAFQRHGAKDAGDDDMIEKSDAMKQQEKYTEEILKHKPKHTRGGGPIQPWHGLAFLALMFVLMVVVG